MCSKVLSYSSRLQLPVRVLLPSCTQNTFPASATVVQVRGAKKKFGGLTRDPYRTLRKKLVLAGAQKVSKVPLMSNERKDNLMEYPMNINSPGTVFATYAPLEKFAKAPFGSKARFKQRWTAFREGLASVYSGALIRMRLRKIDPFLPIELARKAQEMFVDANKALQEKNKKSLRLLTTENALESLRSEFRAKTFEWKLVEEIERPRIVGARATPYNGKDLIAQIVLRMHTKQIMALYSSAGKVFRGDPTVPKTVIDYIVLERPLETPAATTTPWRIAGKLPPQSQWSDAQSVKALPKHSVKN